MWIVSWKPFLIKKVVEKWNLWIREQYTVCTDWLKRMKKVKLYDYCSLNSVRKSHKRVPKKKKKKKRQTPNTDAQSKRSLSLGSLKEFYKL